MMCTSRGKVRGILVEGGDGEAQADARAREKNRKSRQWRPNMGAGIMWLPASRAEHQQ